MTTISHPFSALLESGCYDDCNNAVMTSSDRFESLGLLACEVSAMRRAQVQIDYKGLRSLVVACVTTPDDLQACWDRMLAKFGDDRKIVPMAVRRGLADSFLKFSADQYSKMETSCWLLYQLMRFVHPKGRTPDQIEALSYIASQKGDGGMIR